MKMGLLSVVSLALMFYNVESSVIDVGYDDAMPIVFTYDGVESYKTLYVEDGFLYIGAASVPMIEGPGYLFKVDAGNISDPVFTHAEFEVVNDTSTGAISCRKANPDSPETLCRNFIKVILDDPANSDHLLVCGTNAEFPRCYTVHKNSSLSEDDAFSGASRCPPKNDQHVASTFGTDNQLYSATANSNDGTGIISRFPTPSGSLDLQTENDPKWLKNPEFISTYKVTHAGGENEILIFFREEGEENINQYPEKLTYSRVAKVCERDLGGNSNILQNRWTTYLKARLDCSANSSDSSSDFPKFQQFYDVLEDTEFVDGIVYAVFSANRNGESVPALCSFSVADMPAVFDSGKYWSQTNSDEVWKTITPGLNPNPGACVADSTSVPEAVLTAVKTHPQIEPLIESETPPLLTSYTGVKFTQISSTKVNAELVLYIGTDRGTILKVLYNGGQPVVLEEVQVYEDTSKPEPVTAMAKSEDDKSLYIGFIDKVVQVPMYQCHRYTDCSQCNGAGDPHCGWDETSDQCIFDTNPGTSCPTPPTSSTDVETSEVLYGDVGLASCDVRNGKWYYGNNNLIIDKVKYTVMNGLGLLVADFSFDDNGVYTMKSDAGAELCVRRLETYPTTFLEPNTTSQGAVVCDGKTLYLYCRAKGPSDLTITWYDPDDSELSVDCDGVNLNGNTGGNFERIAWCKVNSSTVNQIFTCKAGPRSNLAERMETMVTVTNEDCILEDATIQESIEWEVKFHYHMKEMAQWEDDTVNSGTCKNNDDDVTDVGTCDCYCQDP